MRPVEVLIETVCEWVESVGSSVEMRGADAR
jgi:hypothetical protein